MENNKRLLDPGKKPHYSAMYSDEITSALVRIGSGKKAEIDPYTNAAYQVEKDKNRVFTITEAGEILSLLSYDSNAVMIMDLLLTKLARQLPRNATKKDFNGEEMLERATIVFSVSEFMKDYNIKDRKSAKEIIKKAAEQFMKHVSLSGTLYGDTYTASFNLLRNYIAFDKSGYVKFALDPDFAFNMNRSRIAYLPHELKEINRKKYRHAYLMGRYIFDYYSKNTYKQGKSKHPEKYHANILSVKSILKNAPGIPTKEEIEKRGRHYYRDIISPFIENMDELDNTGALKEWYFTHKKGEPLTDEELSNLDIDTFLELNIYFEPNHPIKESAG